MGDTIAQNRRAHHEYSIEDTFEAGIVLRGTEIKSIRAHKVSLADAYARIERDEAWIIGLHIAPWESHGRPLQPRAEARAEAAAPPARDRRAAGQDQGEGADDRAALDLHHRRGRAKVELGLARGKQTWDRRREIAERDAEAGHGPAGGGRAQALRAGSTRRGSMRLARMLQAVDLHAAGEPGRVIVGGVLDVPGATMFEKAQHLEHHGDYAPAAACCASRAATRPCAPT